MWRDNSFILELDIHNLDDKIRGYVDEVGGLEAEILKQRYLDGLNELNLRLLAKEFKVSMKKVEMAIDSADNKLYRHLQKYI